MMPSILSDCLCSLQENQNRLAFVMDTIFYLDVNKKLQIENISYSNASPEELKEMLQSAIGNEDYEKASKIRDELNKRK